MTETFRPSYAEIDLGAIAANAAILRALVAPARLCAVVKADAYGHGAPAVVEAALAGGADNVAVALVEEGVALRESGIESPILLLSEPTAEGIAEAVARRLTLTCYRSEGIEAASKAAAAAGRSVAVHLKVDTGMHRVGADLEDAEDLAAAIAGDANLELAGLFTHLAVADVPDDPFTARQLARLGEVRRHLAARGIAVPLVHAANSAGAIAHPDARLDLVRCGIALYGYAPSAAVAPLLRAGLEARGITGTLRPALSLRTRVHLVRDLEAGERTSYGLAYRLERDSRVAVLPFGYNDGVPRRLFECGGAVLIGGRRRPIAGTVTMDQLIVDCGPDGDVHPGDEAVLIGEQGGEAITAEEWAQRLGTISYEILCGIGPRVPRVRLPLRREALELEESSPGRQEARQ